MENIVKTDVGEFRLQNNDLVRGQVNLVIRPENICIDQRDDYSENCINGHIVSCVFSGTYTRLKVRVGEVVLEVMTEVSINDDFPEGGWIRVYLPRKKYGI